MTLYKPTVPTIADISEDLDLQKDFNQEIEIKYFEGDHLSILNNSELAAEINKDFTVEPIILNGTTKKITTTNHNEERIKI